MSLRSVKIGYASSQSARNVSTDSKTSQAATKVTELVDPFPRAPDVIEPLPAAPPLAPYPRIPQSIPLVPRNPVVSGWAGPFIPPTPAIHDPRVPWPSYPPPANFIPPFPSAEYPTIPNPSPAPSHATPSPEVARIRTKRLPSIPSAPELPPIGANRLPDTPPAPELRLIAARRLPSTPPAADLPLVAAKRLPSTPVAELTSLGTERLPNTPPAALLPPTAAKRLPGTPSAAEFPPLVAKRLPSIPSAPELLPIAAKRFSNSAPATKLPPVVTKRLPNTPPRAKKAPVRTKRPLNIPPAAELPTTRIKRLPIVPPARYSKMVLNQAKVKSVLSGDSLVLSSVENPERERILSLAYCTSPHLKKEGDEEWAFDSRDALRKMVVGKHVQFQVLYVIPNTKREYGVVFLNDGRRLPEEMVKEGWLKLREDAGRKEDAEEALLQLDKLRLLEATARSEDKGLWAPSGGKIDVQHDMGDPQAFSDSWKGKTVDGIVERVLSGDRLLVRLIISSAKHIQVMTLVAGIRAPTTERVNPSNGQAQPAEEHGNEARQFVEERLLQRNVKVDILGLSPSYQLIASIKHPRGSIAIFLLEAGLARCTDSHSTLLGGDMAALRSAEKLAKTGKRGLFKDHVTKAATQGGNLEAQVTRVFSADVIYVRNRAGVEKRVNLSSIRGPRQNEASEAPFRDEAKEFLRKRIIGKHVRLSIDGSRPATEEYDAKEVATITLNDKNIGLQLVQEGWCSVIRHRRDDTDRAPNYDELLAAQETAKEEQKGMWSGKPAKAKQYVDASETLQKAKVQLSTLQRQKKVPAIVDFVKGGSRFVVLIPRENVKLNFVLGGIRAPKSARNPSDKSEPFGQEAHDLATRRLTQRDVEIDVHNIDKVGGFIGELYINKESFAKVLVEEGFATVHAYSAEQSGNAAELLAAEQRAKDARKGLWVDWDPSMDLPEEETDPATDTNGDSSPIKREKDYRDIIITNIDESGKLKLQIIGTSTSALETMMTQFKSFHLNPSNAAGLPGAPKAGDYVAAKFTEDGQWYRARIRSNDRTAKEAEVIYVDYGNSEKIPWSSLRPLSQPQFSPQKLRPQAIDAVLSLLQLPTNKDYLADAIYYINGVTANKELVANVDFTAPEGTLHVTLYDPKISEKLTDSINAEIVSEGHAMVPTKLKAWERGLGDVLTVLREKMAEAKEARLGMWEYGDITED